MCAGSRRATRSSHRSATASPRSTTRTYSTRRQPLPVPLGPRCGSRTSAAATCTAAPSPTQVRKNPLRIPFPAFPCASACKKRTGVSRFAQRRSGTIRPCRPGGWSGPSACCCTATTPKALASSLSQTRWTVRPAPPHRPSSSHRLDLLVVFLAGRLTAASPPRGQPRPPPSS